jgi:hypothetical protein
MLVLEQALNLDLILSIERRDLVLDERLDNVRPGHRVRFYRIRPPLAVADGRTVDELFNFRPAKSCAYKTLLKKTARKALFGVFGWRIFAVTFVLRARVQNDICLRMNEISIEFKSNFGSKVVSV